VPNFTTEQTPWQLGKWNQLAQGSDVTIIATGTQVSRAMGAVELLKAKGVSASVLNASFIAPLDIESILSAVNSTKAIVTAEEANIAGGLGAAVASVISQLPSAQRKPLAILGVNAWAPTNSTDGLLEHFGLTAENIAAKALEVLARD